MRPVAAAAASGSAADGAAAPGTALAPPAAFNKLEALIGEAFGTGGPGGDWKQVEECWVLSPPEGQAPKCLVHFVGGAFVGATPQLAYRPLLEALVARGAMVSGRLAQRDAPGSWIVRPVPCSQCPALPCTSPSWAMLVS